ncbi:hypothetical protein [Cryptosporangium minutisporangium]|uniref:Uncharacterized protein n=1 Tax=Cryptosporangium minutisporangium TaxID=113569 RepID=A0ABP6ST37_9ACTN
MRTLRRVVSDHSLIVVWAGGATLTLLFAGWLLGGFFPVVVAIALGLLVLALLWTIRDLVEVEESSTDGLAGSIERHDRAAADLRDLRTRLRAVEEAQRERDELGDRVGRLESVLALLTRWPRDPIADPVTSSLFLRPTSGSADGRHAVRDGVAGFQRRRAAQEQARKRVARWRTQLASGPDRLAVYADVFWLPRCPAARNRPMLFVRRTRMEAPPWPPETESGRPPRDEFVAAMEERFTDSRSRREVAFWSSPTGEDLARLVARLAADHDRWQDLVDGLPAIVRDGDDDRLGPATVAEIGSLVADGEPVRVARYVGLIAGARTAEPAFRHAYVVWTDGDPVAALLADTVVRALDGMTADRGGPAAGPDVRFVAERFHGAGTAGMTRWHGVEGLRADARSVLEQRRGREAAGGRRRHRVSHRA